MSDSSAANRRLLYLVMLAIGLWGGLLAAGAFLFGYDQRTGEVHFAPNALRGLIVLGCVLAFLGSWAWLLAARRRA